MVTIRSRKNKKGYYDVLTTMFLIIVIVAVTVGVIFYHKGFLIAQHGLNERLREYSTGMIAREKLYSCFGTVMRSEYVEYQVCENGQKLELDKLDRFIEGYSIRQLEHGNCSEKTWNWTTIDSSQVYNTFVYYVPILDNETEDVCLSTLELKI